MRSVLTTMPKTMLKTKHHCQAKAMRFFDFLRLQTLHKKKTMRIQKTHNKLRFKHKKRIKMIMIKLTKHKPLRYTKRIIRLVHTTVMMTSLHLNMNKKQVKI